MKQKVSPEEVAFIRAICADPLNDLPRLVFADWLDENGHDDRAALIRIGIEIARAGLWYELIPGELRTRYESLHKLREEQLKATPRFQGVRWVNLFDRGFLFHCWPTSVAAFLKHCPAIYNSVPVTSLKVSSCSAKSRDEFAASPYSERLSCLDLSGCRLGSDGVIALIGSTRFGNLRSLGLQRNRLTDEAVLALSRMQHLARLETLHLGDNPDLTDVSAFALAESTCLPFLNHPDVEHTQLSHRGRGVLDVMSERNWDRLERVRLEQLR